jgi:hypothetical protein
MDRSAAGGVTVAALASATAALGAIISIGRIRLALLLLSLGTLPADAARATPRCTGPFKGTCLRSLFRRFDAAGTCTGDLGPASESGEQTLTLCWRNGATQVSTFDPGSRSWSVIYRNSRGRAVARNTTVVTDTALESTFERIGKRWTVSRSIADPDAITVVCPNGRTEAYSSTVTTNTPTQPRCNGLEHCPPGPLSLRTANRPAVTRQSANGRHRVADLLIVDQTLARRPTARVQMTSSSAATGAGQNM